LCSIPTYISSPREQQNYRLLGLETPHGSHHNLIVLLPRPTQTRYVVLRGPRLPFILKCRSSN